MSLFLFREATDPFSPSSFSFPTPLSWFVSNKKITKNPDFDCLAVQTAYRRLSLFLLGAQYKWDTYLLKVRKRPILHRGNLRALAI